MICAALAVEAELVARHFEQEAWGPGFDDLSGFVARAAIDGCRGIVSYGVVDMESHLIAQLAVANAMRFVALRVVIDAAGRNIPPTALACVSSDGDTSRWRLSRLLLGRPSDTLDVIKLSADWWLARKALLYCSEMLGASVRGIEL
jgi:hypothetical protein